MESTNSFFKEGIELSNNKNYTGAIEVLEQAKTLTKDVDQLAIIDFSISVSKFGIDPVIWVQSYLDLADNRLYPARTRALAMQRMYLSYVRSNDTDLFWVMRDWLSMSGASDSEIKLAFMKKAYEIYPLPGSMLYLMQVELASVNNRTDAITVYNKYQPKIDDGIKIMANSAGELIEATSAMLWSAQILGNLYRDYAISNRKEVESFYKNLIQFDQEKKITTNKQYSLVYYANFLADIGDNEGAQKVIKTFLEEEIRPVVREGLPKTKNLTWLRNMENITDPDIQSFIQFLGPTIQ